MSFLENRLTGAMYQSGLKRERCAVDPVLCLDGEIRKEQVNEARVAAVFFFHVDKGYDMLWRESC